jgi:hypothetical protein
MRIVTFVSGKVAPVATMLIPQTLASNALFARTTSRSWRQGSIDWRLKALGRHASDWRRRRRRGRLWVEWKGSGWCLWCPARPGAEHLYAGAASIGGWCRRGALRCSWLMGWLWRCQELRRLGW